MAYSLSPWLKPRFFITGTNRPLAGGLMYTYKAGTTENATTYSDDAGTPNTNPIQLDSDGQCDLFLDDAVSYRIILKNAAGVTQFDKDRVASIGSTQVQSFNSIAALRLRSGTTNANAAKTLGYYAAGDGGANAFYWDSTSVATDNSGTIIKPTSVSGAGRWIAVDTSVLSPLQFGAKGDGINADYTAMVACFGAGLNIDLGEYGKNFKIAGVITLSNGHNVFSSGGKITQTQTNTEIFNGENKSNIRIHGCGFVGFGTDYLNSDSARAVVLYCGTSGSDNWVYNCAITGFGYAGVRFQGNTNCKFFGNTVTGPGYPTLTAATSGRNYGVVYDSGCSGILVHNNVISKHAQGVRIEICSDVIVSNNRIFDITGQHGIYAGSELSNVVISNNVISNTDLIGIKVQTSNTASADTYNVTITGNTVYDCADHGILVTSGSYPTLPTKWNNNVVVTGNTVRTAASSGITVDSSIDVIVSDNTVLNASQQGVVFASSSRVKIANNNIKGCGFSGIRDKLACDIYQITGNTIVNCSTASNVSDRFGIYVAGTNAVISDNIIKDGAALQAYGIYVYNNDASTFSVYDNISQENTGAGWRMSAASVMRKFSGNIFGGTAGVSLTDPISKSVASAAALVLPHGCNVIKVTGTTTITSIQKNGYTDKIVTLVFEEILTVTRGSNLILNAAFGNFVTTANDTLTLANDGMGNWYEVYRSVN